MGKDDVARRASRVVANAMTDRFGRVRKIGNRLPPLAGEESYVLDDVFSLIGMKRIFTGSVSSNPGRPGSRKTQCSPESGRTTMLSRISTDQRSRGRGYRCIASIPHVTSPSTSGPRGCTLEANNRSNWVTALQRNAQFSSSHSAQDGAKTDQGKVSIEYQSSEDAHTMSEQPQDGPLPDPPGLFATMGAMTAGGTCVVCRLINKRKYGLVCHDAFG